MPKLFFATGEKVANPDTNKAIDRVVAFIDILGFEVLVKCAFQGENTIISCVHDALRTISAHAIITNAGPFGHREFSPSVQATAFSDCIVISDIIGDFEVGNVLSKVAMLAGFLLRNGILCRGGIATGPTVHNDRVLFGVGVIEAYKIEKQVAVYPRIIVRDDLVLRAAGPLVPKLKRDSDGLWFIDIFELLRRFEGDGSGLLAGKSLIQMPDIDAFRHVRDFIIGQLHETRSDLHKWMKYRWLANRFNEAINDYVPGEIDPIVI
jgi:hypothetical protein